jgi:hypothetical protein
MITGSAVISRLHRKDLTSKAACVLLYMDRAERGRSIAVVVRDNGEAGASKKTWVSGTEYKE